MNRQPHERFTPAGVVDWETIDAAHAMPRQAAPNHQPNPWCWCGPDSFFYRLDEGPPRYVYVHRGEQ